MLGWLWVGIDRFGRANARGLAWRLGWVPGWLLRRIQRAKLSRTLRCVWKHSPVQRKRWEDAGVRYRELGDPAALGKIPYLDLDDLREHPEHYTCVPEDRLTHVMTTSGTSGRSKKVYFTNRDMVRQAKMIGTKLRRLPGTRRVLAMYSVDHPTWSSGAMARRGIEEAGLFGLLCGIHRDPQVMIDLIKEYRIDTLMAVTGFMHRLTTEMKDKEDLRNLGVKYLLVGGQAWSEELRRDLEQAWGAKALDVYGTNECACGIASECEKQDGLHLAEVDFWVEVLDPKTERPVPEGVEGELVVTTLSREAMPLVRFRTRDLAMILPTRGRCACGMAVRKLGRIRGRLDDVVILASNNVYPDEWDLAILGVEGVTDFQVTIDRLGYLERVSVTVESDQDTPQLREAVKEAALGIKNVRAGCERSKTVTLGEVKVVKRGTLSAGRPKAVRIVDLRGSERSAAEVHSM